LQTLHCTASEMFLLNFVNYLPYKDYFNKEYTIFWDITPCSLSKVNRRFGWTNRLHLQNRKISRARNQREAGGKQSQRTTRRYIPEYSILFTTTDVRTSNPIYFNTICRSKPIKSQFVSMWSTSTVYRYKKKTLRGFGPLANYADRATATSWRSSTNCCGQRVLRGQRNGSPRSYSRFSWPEPLLFLPSSSSVVLTTTHEAEWTPFQTHCLSENLEAPGIEPGTSGSVARNSDH
jgi:hypothetical protein